MKPSDVCPDAKTFRDRLLVPYKVANDILDCRYFPQQLYKSIFGKSFG